MAGDQTFTLTEDHITLLRRANLRWDDCEYGAPAIDCKRPYGNSDVELDIAEILGWELFVDQHDERHLTAVQSDLARRLHEETLQALQCVLAGCSIRPGIYRRSTPYLDDWELVQ